MPRRDDYPQSLISCCSTSHNMGYLLISYALHSPTIILERLVLWRLYALNMLPSVTSNCSVRYPMQLHSTFNEQP